MNKDPTGIENKIKVYDEWCFNSKLETLHEIDNLLEK